MKYTLILGMVFSCLGIAISSCTKTEIVDPNVEPRIILKSKDVLINSATEIVLSGEISSLNREEIMDVGFVLYDLSAGGAPPVEISLGNKHDVGPIDYKHKVSKPFAINAPMAFSFFVKTKKAFYLGDRVQFKVDLIKVDNTSIYYGKIGAAIEIKGDFEQLNENDFLSVDDRSSRRLTFKRSIDKRSLFIDLPASDYEHGQTLTVRLNQRNGQQMTFQRELVKIELLGSFNLPEGPYYYTDLLNLSGQGVPKTWSSKLNIIINGKSLVWNNQMRISDFGPFNTTSMKVEVDDGHSIYELSGRLRLHIPDGRKITLNTLAIHPAGLVIIKGDVLTKSFNNTFESIKMGQVPVESFYSNSEQTLIRAINTPGEYPVTFVSPMYEVVSTAKLKIVPFSCKPLVQNTIYKKESFSVKGSFIKGNEYYFFESGVNPSHVRGEAISADEVVIKLNLTSAGVHKGELIYSNAHNVPVEDNGCSFTINVLPAEITSISKNVVAVGDVLELYGRGLLDVSYIQLGQLNLYVRNPSEKMIKIDIPHYIPPGEYKIDFLSQDYKKWNSNIVLKVI